MRRDDTRRTFIAYDIPDDKRRGRITKLLLTYGDRIQYSVFIVDIIPLKLLRLKDEIRQQVEASEDSVLFCDLGRLSELGEKRFSYVGQSRDTTDNDVLIL
ncbi:CRISPR-associated endonuclease Cas2 [Rothia aeria]